GEVDPATGEPAPEKIYRYQGDRRRVLVDRLAAIAQAAAHLEGDEGARRKQKALEKAVDDAKKSREQYGIMREAKERAVHLAREDRVNTLAQSFAKSHRSNLG